jgi:hypothetical protein
VGPDIETFFLGQSVLTPIGGPWNRLSFNWFADGPGTIPTATGSLFILDQEYLGTPNLLNSSTPGFVGQSQSISSGMYEFAPNVQILANKLYFFYTNVSITASGSPSDVYDNCPGVGCQAYIALSPTSSFAAFGGGVDANFGLTGTPIPEPASTWPLSGILVLMAGKVRRTHHQASRP